MDRLHDFSEVNIVIQDDQPNMPYLLEFRPPGEFKYENARKKLATLKFSGGKGGAYLRYSVPGDLVTADEVDDRAGAIYGRQAQVIKLGGYVDLESRLTVGCAGVILSYLQRRRSTMFLPGDEEGTSYLRVSSIGMFTMKNVM